MTKEEKSPTPPESCPTLADRCRHLGFPVWEWDEDGALSAEPEGWGAADAWLRAPLLRDWVTEARQRWPAQDEALLFDLMQGGWLIPLVAPRSSGSTAVAAALALSPEVLRTNGFEAVSKSGGADVRTMRLALMGLARSRRADVVHHAPILRWLFADGITISQSDYAIASFSRQLSDAYEQISLLYQIADSMNRPDDPDRFVRLACELLQNTLDFEWVAVRLAALPALGPTLANDLVVVGVIPGSNTRYDKLAGSMANSGADDVAPAILEPDTDDLAGLVGSEVFANPLVVDNRLAGFLLAGNKCGDDPDVSSNDMQLLSATADYLGAFLHNTAMYNEQRATFLGIVKALSASIDAKDRYTRGHSERVAQLASELTMAAGLGAERAERVRLAGLLHDVGKIGVPEHVLVKPGRLTDEEFEAIKLHPTIGYHILKEIEPLQDVLPGVLHHHERWDGKGYPHNLRGDEIPLIARILAVADTFDAMSSNRSYRAALSRERVLDEIKSCAGTQFDPMLAKHFLALDLAEYDRMVVRHEALEAQVQAA